MLKSLAPPEKEYTAAALVRTSTLMQVESGLSMITQPERIREFAQRNGITLACIYEEPGISGRSANRKIVERLLRDARAGRFNLLIVTDVSRFFRNLEALIGAIRTLKSYEVDFISIDDGIDTRRKDSWGNELVLVILGVLAELYAVQLAHNTREGKYRRFRLGLWNGAVPFGYCNGLCSSCKHANGEGYCPRFGAPDIGDGENLVLHPIESEAVRLAFETYSTGEFSYNDIAQFLNQYRLHLPDGSVRRFRLPRHQKPNPYVPAPHSIADGPHPYGYRPIYKGFVRFLLARPFYAGYVTYTHDPPPQSRLQEQVIEENTGNHPAVISRTLFDQVQRLRQSVHTNSRRQSAQRRIYPLSGVLHCGHCHAPMRGNSANGGARYYQCSGRASKSPLADGGLCPQPMLRAQEVEEAVLALLKNQAVPSFLRADILAYCYLQDDVEVIDFKRRQLIARIKRYTQLFEVGAIAWEAFQTQVGDLRGEIVKLTPEMQPSTPQAHGLLDDLAALWQAAQPLERKNMASLLFRSLSVKDATLVDCQMRQFMMRAEE